MPTIYAAMRDRLLVVTGTPGARQVRTRLAGHDLECVAASPERPDCVLAGTFDAGLHRSTDGGESFVRVGDWMEDSITAVAASPHDPDVWWAGTEPSRVYRSSDGGRSWTERPGLTALDSADEWSFPPRPSTHHVRWLEPDPNDPDRLYVGVEAGAIVRTEDGGETWIDRPETAPGDPHTMTTHPDDTWRFPQKGLDHRYCWSVAVDPGDPGTVLTSAASGPRSAHRTPGESYVYRRTGDGPWTRIEDDALPTGEGVLRAVLATDGPGECYALSNRGLFRSIDAGKSWARLDVDWPDGLTERTPRGLAIV